MATSPDTKVIVLTGQNDQSNALKAVALGAYDFLAKPFEPEVLNLGAGCAQAAPAAGREQAPAGDAASRCFVGPAHAGPAHAERLPHDREVLNTNASVMLLGESGTGKEILARGLHQQSNRKGGKFVAINCAAIPEKPAGK